MTQESEVFQKHCKDYLARIADIDMFSVKDTLGLVQEGDQFFVPFFGQNYQVSGHSITDSSGKIPVYGVFAILSKYLILCPDKNYQDTEWSAFKDFKKISHFTNVNFFNSDTENVITSAFTGKPDILKEAALKFGGLPNDKDFSYDLVMEFQAFPRISLLLLFNDGDEDFPAYSTVLFQKHAEHYLDPESLAMTSAFLAKSLKNINPLTIQE